MSATFADDLAEWLAGQGVGTVGVDLFEGQLPSDPIDAVLLVESGGRPSDRAQKVQPTRIQVTARNASYAAARAKAWAVHGLLNEPPAPRAMGSSKALYSKALQSPFSLGQDDERQAWRFVFNVEFLIQHT